MILGPGSRISKPRSSRRSQRSKALPNDLPRHWALMIAIARAGPSSRFSRSRRRLGIDQASTHRRVASGCRGSYFSRSTFAEALQPHRCHGRQEGRLWINRIVANRSASRTRDLRRAASPARPLGLAIPSHSGGWCSEHAWARV